MNTKKRLGLHISTIVVMTACFSVIIGAVVFGLNLKKVLTLWGNDIQMTVYLSKELSSDAQVQLEKEITNNNVVGKVSYVNQEAALNEFRTQMASYAPDILQDNDLLKLIPSSFQVSLKSTIPTAEQLKALSDLAQELKKKTGVDEVSYGQDWIKKYASFVLAFENIIFVIGLIIFAAAVLVISNTIRASISSRRDEIEVLEMIGATPWMIRKPYFIEGAIIGIVSALCGLFVGYFVFHSILQILSSEINFLKLSQQLEFLSALHILTVILFGALLGSLGAYLSARSINDGWAASS